MKNLARRLISFCFLTLFLTIQADPAQALPAANVTASDGLHAGWVRITWDSTYVAGRHNVQRSVSAGGIYSNVGHIDIDGSKTSYVYDDDTAVQGTKYYYKISTCLDISCETSDYDDGWRAYLGVVTNVNASNSTSSDYISVSWRSVTGTEFYEVYRASSVNGAKTLVGTSATILFLDTEVPPAATYYYWVKACYNNGIKRCSIFYDYDDGYRLWPVVQNVVASDGGHVGFVRVGWDAVSGASGYEVYYSKGGNTLYQGHETVAGTETYDYYLPDAGNQYGFAVTPCFGSSCGNTKSDPDIGWLDYPAPTNLQATDGTSITNTGLTWDEVDPNARYKIFRDFVNGPTGKEYVKDSSVNETAQDTYNDGALPGTHYNYWVVACPSSVFSTTGPGCSAYSKSDAGHYNPAKPANLAASDGTSPLHVEVTWDAVAGASSYAVERTDNISVPVWTGPFPSPTNSFNDATASEGVRYWYVASACGRDYCGEPSGNDSGYLQGVCYALTLNTTGNGSLTANPTNSIGCSAGEYIKGEKIVLNATPDPNWVLEKWTNTNDDSRTDNQNSLTMPANAHAVTAAFSSSCNPLTLHTTGSGTLEADPLSSTGCSAGEYTVGEEVTLTATPDSTWFLQSWNNTDDDLSTDTVNKYTMIDSAHTVTAKFARTCYKLSLNTVGNGTLETALDFSTGCSAGSFAEGEKVELNADPDTGWKVDSWLNTDDDSSTGNNNQHTMAAADHSVTVTFSLICNPLNFRLSAGGSVTASPLASTGCPKNTYIPGASINLKATPVSGWQLVSWFGTDDDSSTALDNSCTMVESFGGLTVDVNFTTDLQEIFSNGFESQEQ